MKSFLDTSVLVAVFHADHPHHQASFDLFVSCTKDDACCAMHSLAEVYATLTGLRATAPRTTGDHALLFIGNIRERLTLVGLDEQEYIAMLEAAATAGLSGGAIYDAILSHCALKAGAATIYTWNTKDFLRLPAAIASRVKTPDQAGISAVMTSKPIDAPTSTAGPDPHPITPAGTVNEQTAVSIALDLVPKVPDPVTPAGTVNEQTAAPLAPSLVPEVPDPVTVADR